MSAIVEQMKSEIESLTKERAAHRTQVEAQNTEISRLKLERDEYAKAADTQAMAHKVERDALAASRYAYATEFSLDEEGQPDVGSIHQNIRALKAAAKLALDALYEAQTADDGMAKWDRNKSAITALRQAGVQ